MNVLCLCLIAIFGAAQAACSQPDTHLANQAPSSADEGVRPCDVFVEATWDGSWGKSEHARLDADGHVEFVYRNMNSEIAKESSIESGLVRYLFSRLVEMGFYELPSKYRSGGDILTEKSDGKMSIISFGVVDGGSTKVRFVFGERDHEVFMPHPANYAPDQLKNWCAELHEIVRDAVSSRNMRK